MDLGKTQLISLVTKAITTALGIVQSVIVIRILSPAEFGLVGLVMSIGGVIGVSQHLGIVDGAIREIAVLKKKREIGKVFWVSHIVRQAVTIPLSIILLLGAGFIATHVYDKPGITLYLQIFAAVLVLQGLQDVLGATLTGIKKFGALYVVQIITAAINIAVFGLFTWRWGITGFFWAIILTTAIMVAIFVGIISQELRGFLRMPSRAEIVQYGRRVMRIGAYMYLARIFFVVWQRLPLLILGGVLAAEELGFLNASLTFGSRLTIIAMALSEVNLSWMSSLYVSRREEFQATVTRNMHRVLVLMVGLTLILLFFTPEIIRFIIGSEYAPAQPIILVMTLAFFLYSLTDIGTSSVFVAADRPRLRAGLYGFMMAVSAVIIGWLFFTEPHALAASLGVLAGAIVSYVGMLVLSRVKFGMRLLTPQLAIFIIALLASVAWLFQGPSLTSRLGVFLLLCAYIWWETRRNQLLPPFKQLLRVWSVSRSTETANHQPSLKLRPAGKSPITDIRIICFAGAEYDRPFWTNRQHIMSRLAEHYPVLYVEPRVWIFRYLAQHWRHPRKILRFFKRIVWVERRADLYVKSQWNLIPGSRESALIAAFNHWLNRWNVLFSARLLGFLKSPITDHQSHTVLWLYDTEAAEYLSAFPGAKVVYDCVDDHAAQAGVDRNSTRVREEEGAILKRADLVTVTSQRLFELKKDQNPNVHLVLNAGDVELFTRAAALGGKPLDSLQALPTLTGLNFSKPIIGTVGALDAYKIDFELITEVARRRPDWQFLFLGESVVADEYEATAALNQLPNVYFAGVVPREVAPYFVRHFAVCMIPYRSSQYNQASFPLKFWEFMASGKPVVVSGLPELKAYAGRIGYAHSADEFVEQCERALADTPELAEARVRLARDHSWDKRAAHLRQLLEGLMRTNV